MSAATLMVLPCVQIGRRGSGGLDVSFIQYHPKTIHISRFHLFFFLFISYFFFKLSTKKKTNMERNDGATYFEFSPTLFSRFRGTTTGLPFGVSGDAEFAPRVDAVTHKAKMRAVEAVRVAFYLYETGHADAGDAAIKRLVEDAEAMLRLSDGVDEPSELQRTCAEANLHITIDKIAAVMPGMIDFGVRPPLSVILSRSDHDAAWKLEAVQVLLRHGALPLPAGQSVHAPLRIAATWPFPAVFELFLEHCGPEAEETVYMVASLGKLTHLAMHKYPVPSVGRVLGFMAAGNLNGALHAIREIPSIEANGFSRLVYSSARQFRLPCCEGGCRQECGACHTAAKRLIDACVKRAMPSPERVLELLDDCLDNTVIDAIAPIGDLGRPGLLAKLLYTEITQTETSQLRHDCTHGPGMALYLLELGADPVAQQWPGPTTALELCTKRVIAGHHDMRYTSMGTMWEAMILSTVRAHGAKTESVAAVFSLACQSGMLDAVRTLLQCGVCADAIIPGESRSHMAEAAMAGNSELVEILLNSGADANGMGCQGLLACVLARCSSNTDVYARIAQCLLEHGVDVINGAPLVVACSNSHISVKFVNVILGHMTTPDLQHLDDAPFYAVLSQTRKFGQLLAKSVRPPSRDVVTALLRETAQSAGRDLEQIMRCSAMKTGSKNRDAKEMENCKMLEQLMLDHRYRPLPVEWLPLACMARLSNRVIVQLVREGLDPRASCMGWPALQWAIWWDTPRACEALLKNGATLDDVLDVADVPKDHLVCFAKAEMHALIAAIRALATGRHPRLGSISPVGLLIGFDWIISYIAQLTLVGPRFYKDPKTITDPVLL
jgi:hypothetical protein